MPEPTPSQLKIDGIVTVPEGTIYKDFERYFNSKIKMIGCTFSGNISPLNPDAESFMVEVPKHQFKEMQKLLEDYKVIIQNQHGAIEANNKAYSDLAEQLRQEKEKYERLSDAYTLLSAVNTNKHTAIQDLNNTIAALELRLKVKDSPIKAGLKRIWKWFKGLVGK